MLTSKVWLLAGLLAATATAENEGADVQLRNSKNELSSRRWVLQTSFGDLHIAFYDNAAPKTTAKYNTNHFFRVDKGFVAQVAGIEGNLMFPINAEQAKYAGNTVPLEVHEDLKHDRAGLLSLARHDDPNSGGSSFSIMLGPAPHLDMNYAIFGEVTEGIETLRSMEGVETTREGIFVMPKDRITIHSTYTYDVDGARNSKATGLTPESTSGSISVATMTTKTATKSVCAADVLAALKAVRQKLVQ